MKTNLSRNVARPVLFYAVLALSVLSIPHGGGVQCDSAPRQAAGAEITTNTSPYTQTWSVWHTSTSSTTWVLATYMSTISTTVTESRERSLTVTRTETGGAPRTITRTSTYTSQLTSTEFYEHWSTYHRNTGTYTTWASIKESVSTRTTTHTNTHVINFGTPVTSVVVWVIDEVTETWERQLVKRFMYSIDDFAKRIIHLISGTVVQVEIIVFRGRFYGPLPPEASEPSLLDMLIENAPLIAIVAGAIIAACLLVMKKRGVKLSSIRERLTRQRKKKGSS